ncbi:hypothetical protein ADL26_02660 [Thermoactinomyces vulgaris]|nr:hypothetical protein ADL26_02660 [Thermoactinomyces vulgaris]
MTSRDVAWNGTVAAAGTRTAAWGFIATGTAASPAVTCSAVDDALPQTRHGARVAFPARRASL